MCGCMTKESSNKPSILVNGQGWIALILNDFSNLKCIPYLFDYLFCFYFVYAFIFGIQELVLYDKELLNRPKMLIVTKLDKKGATNRFQELQQMLQSVQEQGKP